MPLMPPDSDPVALDIGGANLKAADGLGWSESIAFPLWKRWRELPRALTELVARRQTTWSEPVRFPSTDTMAGQQASARHPASGGGALANRGPGLALVATMTGEICDCYPSRAAGVAHIAESLAVASEALGSEEAAGVYLVDGRIVSAAEAACHWPLAAASNWHVLARLAASLTPSARALLLDVGSTTTDIGPVVNGRPAPLAHDDAGRMLAGELVYTGLERTAVSTIVRRLPHRGLWRPLASERFADARDAWLMLGGLPEDATSCDTADGGPATRDAARVRLARTMLLDPEAFREADATAAAAWITSRQAAHIARSLCRVAKASGSLPEVIVLSGHGDALATKALVATGWNPTIVSLAAEVGPAVARAAPAHALACLARGIIE